MHSSFLTPQEREILTAINQLKCLREYLQLVCIDILALITEYAQDIASDHGTKPFHANSMAFQDALAEQFRLCCTFSRHRSGSVLEKHVQSVLLSGNVRERCTIIALVLTRQNHLVEFALQNPKKFPTICSERARKLLQDKKTVCNGNLFREHTVQGHTKTQTWTSVAKHAANPLFSKRWNRDPQKCKEYSLKTTDICPALSEREREMLQRSIKNEELRSWNTGHMIWEVDPKCSLAQRSKRLGERMIAGVSGHTDQLLQALQIFTYFDLRLATLACVLWLVGCDHHSCLEVLATAEFFGLEHEKEQPSVQRLEDMIRAVSAERCVH